MRPYVPAGLRRSTTTTPTTPPPTRTTQPSAAALAVGGRRRRHRRRHRPGRVGDGAGDPHRQRQPRDAGDQHQTSAPPVQDEITTTTTAAAASAAAADDRGTAAAAAGDGDGDPGAAAAAAGADRGAATAAADHRSAAAAADHRRTGGPRRFITYTVTGTKAPLDRISVTYTDASGRQRTQQNVYIPWSLTVTPISMSEFGSVQASSLLRLSKLNCSITTSDGRRSPRSRTTTGRPAADDTRHDAAARSRPHRRRHPISWTASSSACASCSGWPRWGRAWPPRGPGRPRHTAHTAAVGRTRRPRGCSTR